MSRRSAVVAAVWLVVGCAGQVGEATVDAGGRGDGPTGDARDLGPEVDDFIAARMAASHIPGLAATIVKHGDVAWSHGYGFANVASGTPVTSDTIFMLASISKTIVAVAAMQLVEAGTLDLDADVETYVPFAVRNPAFPATPITMRQLLTHSSGIEDTDAIFDGIVDGDSAIALGDWLRSYLVPGGSEYSAGVYANAAPGTRFSYSNEAVALAGYVIERAAGVGFDAYCEAHVFTPLDMTRTSWHLAGLDVAEIATPYEAQAPLAHYGYPDYPNGALRTSAPQLGRFLAMMTEGGAYGGARLVTAGSVAEMLRVQLPAVDATQGLIFYHWSTGSSGSLVGHDGADAGVHTVMAFRPSDGAGVIVLTNGYTSPAGMNAIFDRLFEESAAL